MLPAALPTLLVPEFQAEMGRTDSMAKRPVRNRNILFENQMCVLIVDASQNLLTSSGMVVANR